MALTMSTALKAYLDTELENGGAAVVLAAINSTHTAFDGPTRAKLAKMLGSIGSASDFETACTSNTAAATVRGYTTICNRLEKKLGGRGNLEELVLCIADGTIT